MSEDWRAAAAMAGADAETLACEPDAPGTLSGNGSAEISQADAQVAPLSIGPYTLVHLLGQGGMGQVWLADQSSPVQRQVALKIIRSSFTHASAMARFASEQQALAVMDHPAIAKVFDAGTGPGGQPFYVMEFIAGPPINLYCDLHRLTVRQRLELFLQVCDGVQHAHQKAILHRDLKPSNVLVAEVDGVPHPRIIDFGLAKALTEAAALDPGEAATFYTREDQLVGTPGYMSPEQADPTCRDIDTRADVYSLGVILYELLVAALPFHPQSWQQKGMLEMLRRLREDPVPRPSSRVTPRPSAIQTTATAAGRSAVTPTPSPSSAELAADLAAKRGTVPRQLTRVLRGDLDWITVKALEPDRERRYDSPSALAADLRRYLHDEPVLASPPSWAYRTRKFVRRHRVAVAAGSALAGMLVVLAVSMTLLALRIARERDRANREAAIALHTSDFLGQLFSTADPSKSRGNTITVRQMLDQGSAQVRTGLRDEPDVQARLLQDIGDAYVGLGLYAQAQPLLEQSVALSTHALGSEDPATLSALRSLSELLYLRKDFARAERMALDLKARSEHVYAQSGHRSADRLELLRNQRPLAEVYAATAREPLASAMDKERLSAFESGAGAESAGAISALADVAEDTENEQRTSQAVVLGREVVARSRKEFGEDAPSTLHAELGLAEYLSADYRYDQAEAELKQVVATQTRVLGPDHPTTLGSLFWLGNLYFLTGQYQKAEKLLGPLAEREAALFGPNDSQTLNSRLDLAAAYAHDGHTAAAGRLFGSVMAAIRENEPPTDLLYVNAVLEYAHFLSAGRQYAEAESLLNPAIAALRRAGSRGSVLRLEDLLAGVKMHAGHYAEAKAIQDRLLAELAAGHHDAGESAVLDIHYNAACNGALNGHPEEALAHLEYLAAHGFDQAQSIAEDPDLASLRRDPRFLRVLARIRANGRQ